MWHGVIILIIGNVAGNGNFRFVSRIFIDESSLDFHFAKNIFNSFFCLFDSFIRLRIEDHCAIVAASTERKGTVGKAVIIQHMHITVVTRIDIVTLP